MHIIPHGKHHITDADKQAVIEALEGEFITQGPRIAEFENAFAEYVGAKYAIAVANGTAALHLCAMALDVKPGQRVITSPLTFVASANCVRYCGGEVIFADVDPETYTIDPKKVREILEADAENIVGIIPVDLTGRPADLPALREIADEYGLWIIEDACHAPGGFFHDAEGKHYQCGDGNLAEMAIFSFHPVKHIACGEGGMITTNDPELARKARLYRTHGIIKDPAEMSQNDGGWYYEMQELGYNYRFTDFQAALGTSQLQRAVPNLQKRREIAEKYANAFADVKEIKHQSGNVEGHAYHLYVIQVEKRKELYDFLRAHGILTQIHYIPVHLQPYYKQFGWKTGDFPNAESYYSQCISLPMFPTLTEAEQDFVIEKVIECLKSFA
ncbi:UDP-4-amino-4,6-dideoxy-N-acetyl-beta-L-altrosamine transaminase [Peijinzhouia sedimentorum]